MVSKTLWIIGIVVVLLILVGGGIGGALGGWFKGRISCTSSGGHWEECRYGPAGSDGCYCNCERNGLIRYETNTCKTTQEMINMGYTFPFPNNPLQPKYPNTICCETKSPMSTSYDTSDKNQCSIDNDPNDNIYRKIVDDSYC